MRRILGALVVAAFLSGVAVPVEAASPTRVSCTRHKKAKKAKFAKPGKYKAPKLKVKKAGKRHRYNVKPLASASSKQT